MKRLHIRGLVRIADRTRDALAGRTAFRTIAQVRNDVAAALRTVDELLNQEGLRVEQLPAPTRNAYRYLACINWDAVQPWPLGPGVEPAPGRIRFSGLTASFDRLLNQLGGTKTVTNAATCFESIVRTSQRLADDLANDPIDRSELTPASRGILAWLTYFAQKNNFDHLVEAIGSARVALTAEIEHHQAFELPVVVHFRPTRGLYRVRRFADATLVQLPTPMMIFDAEGFALLAAAICGDALARHHVLNRTATEAYRAIQAQLDGPGGDSRTGGACHDLEAAFSRVNTAYFGGAIAKPRLTWSRRITSCKFGHYDPVRDELMVSATLDSSEVPANVLDFVVYHELLHKKHGATWQNGRQAVHTPAFREEERRFAEYTAAENAIKELAKRFASGSARTSPA